jgi:DNA-directed RNA polymerase specialized sigma24 family protein
VSDRKISPLIPPPETAAIRWDQLSVQSTAILRQVVVPVSLEGYSPTETAKRIGISPSSVSLLSDYFASEVSELAQNKPPADD